MPAKLTTDEAIYGLRSALEPMISPDGSRIVYAQTTYDQGNQTTKPTTHLWSCALDGSDARRITYSGSRNNGARWSPDGSKIAFISDRVEKPAKAGIFVIPADQPGEPRMLTEHNQGIGSVVWSPDGSKIAYTTTFDPENPEEKEREKDEPEPVHVTSRLDYKSDGRGYLGDTRGQVWIVDVDSGERRMLTTTPLDHGNPIWSPDGKTVALSESDANGNELLLVDVATGSSKAVTPHDSGVGLFSFSPSGDRLIYTADPDHSHQSDLYLYTLDSKETKRLTDDLSFVPAGGRPGVAAPSNPVWLDDRQVMFHGARSGGSGLYVVDADSGSIETLQTWEATHGGLSLDDGKRHVVQSHGSLQSVGEIAVYDMQSGDTKVITRFNQDLLEEHGLAQWERIEVQRGKYAIEAWLLKPAGFDPAKRYPVVMDIHGGPNGHHGYSFSARNHVLASHGYLVVFANPRGSSSYGREFTTQVFEDWGGEDYQDLMAIMDNVCERPYVDPERTGIYGYSYGGYMTSWIIGQTQRFKACVCGAPCFDLESFFGTSDIGYRFGLHQFGSHPHEGREWYAAHSPSSFAHRATTPTMIIQGTADYRCPVGQGEQMFVELKKAGCDVEFVRYPGMPHGFTTTGPAHFRADVTNRALAWYKKYLGEPA